MFQRLEVEYLHEPGGLLRQAAFDSVNCVLTSLYSTANRVVQSNNTQALWKSAPLAKQLPEDSILRETAIKAAVDGIQYQVGAVGGHDREAVWYSEKVASEHDSDVARMQQDIAARSAAEFLEESSLDLECVAGIFEEELVQDVARILLATDQQDVMRMDPQDVEGAENGNTGQDADQAVMTVRLFSFHHEGCNVRDTGDALEAVLWQHESL